MVQITIDVPEQVERDARAVAARTQRRVEDVLQEWLRKYVAQIPIESLPDERILELSEMELSASQQEELSNLLARNRENQLSIRDRKHLDELMVIYRQGMIRKAEALKVAVQRGLRPPLVEKIHT